MVDCITFALVLTTFYLYKSVQKNTKQNIACMSAIQKGVRRKLSNLVEYVSTFAFIFKINYICQ